jgi:hypothetical protein
LIEKIFSVRRGTNLIQFSTLREWRAVLTRGLQQKKFDSADWAKNLKKGAPKAGSAKQPAEGQLDAQHE